MDWMLMPLRRYAEFSGRSRRKEYWMFALLMAIIYTLAGVLMISSLWPMIAAGQAPTAESFTGGFLAGVVLLGLFTLAIFVPALALTVRRLHDRDLSGWWYLGVVILAQVPYLGPVVNLAFLVLMCLPGTPGPNRFSPDPKGAESYEAFA
ncbi:DUF805 domain-containing protein [Novosphingobium bradum]|uniref:DUF805 domain-containing protein n=1 Tax=Novosphingobium bradum TaxID=1737444 RepID=A0ABV7IPL4_9SPHN